MTDDNRGIADAPIGVKSQSHRRHLAVLFKSIGDGRAKTPRLQSRSHTLDFAFPCPECVA